MTIIENNTFSFILPIIDNQSKIDDKDLRAGETIQDKQQMSQNIQILAETTQKASGFPSSSEEGLVITQIEKKQMEQLTKDPNLSLISTMMGSFIGFLIHVLQKCKIIDRTKEVEAEITALPEFDKCSNDVAGNDPLSPERIITSPVLPNLENDGPFGLMKIPSFVPQATQPAFSHENDLFQEILKKPDDVVKASDHRINSLIQLLTKNQLLKEEGIFRESGDRTAIDALVKYLKKNHKDISLEQGRFNFIYHKKSYQGNVHVLTGALKKIYREELNLFGSKSKISAKFFEVGDRVLKCENEKEIIAELKLLVQILPKKQQKNLQSLLSLLHAISNEQLTNKMNPRNLAISCGVNIYPDANIEDFTKREEIAINFIQYYPQIFLEAEL